MNRLVECHLRLVVKIACNHRNYGLPLEDLIAHGNIGVLQATQNFDPELGYRFSTYAMWWDWSSHQGIHFAFMVIGEGWHDFIAKEVIF